VACACPERGIWRILLAILVPVDYAAGRKRKSCAGHRTAWPGGVVLVSLREPFVLGAVAHLTASFSYNRLDNPTPLSTSSSIKKLSFNPFTTSGRSRIRKAILRSGPAYEHLQLQTTVDQAGPGKKKQGWRLGTLVSCYAVAVCLLLELALLTYALVTNRPRNGLGMLYEGHCAKVKRLSILLLLPLNIIGTVLISTSNYVMQAVSAPTRQEVDRSHAEGGFRNIGMPTSYDMLWSRPYK
jgi:hypothetical protein